MLYFYVKVASCFRLNLKCRNAFHREFSALTLRAKICLCSRCSSIKSKATNKMRYSTPHTYLWLCLYLHLPSSGYLYMTLYLKSVFVLYRISAWGGELPVAPPSNCHGYHGLLLPSLSLSRSSSSFWLSLLLSIIDSFAIDRYFTPLQQQVKTSGQRMWNGH